MSMIQEFKDFVIKCNVVDMAVGVIIGTAFGKIVSSFVADVVILIPPTGVLKQCRELIVCPTIVVPKQLVSSQVEDS